MVRHHERMLHLLRLGLGLLRWLLLLLLLQAKGVRMPHCVQRVVVVLLVVAIIEHSWGDATLLQRVAKKREPGEVHLVLEATKLFASGSILHCLQEIKDEGERGIERKQSTCRLNILKRRTI
jgi:hypothetical protein